MIINITHRHNKVSPSVKEKIEEWLNNSQERYDIITSAQVTIDSIERGDEVEATLHVNGKDIYAKAQGDNLYIALDALTDKIDRQLIKAKEKMTAKKGGPRHIEPISATEGIEDEPEDESYLEESVSS